MLRIAVLVIPVKMLEVLVNTFRFFLSFIPVNVIQLSSSYHRNFSNKKFPITFMVLYSVKFN